MFKLIIFCFGLQLVYGNLCYSGWSWAVWGACSKPCAGGFRVRYCHRDNNYERERCNAKCYNGGEFYGGACHCPPGTKGACCDNPCCRLQMLSNWPPFFLPRCNAKCYNGGEFYGGACHCPPETKGACCDNINECLSNPCKNGGVCQEPKLNQFVCLCPPGTTQPVCEDIQECLSSPCKNGGNCTEDSLNEYRCVCPPGTTGVNCDDILECASNPCKNGGICNEHINGYTCSCVPGTTGTHCDDILECDSHPCQNGGSCIEMINMYKCNCTNKFTGDNCEKDLMSARDEVCDVADGHKCYVIFIQKETWQDAKNFCAARNGQLAVPDTNSEAQFLENYLESMRVRYRDAVFWIGGKKTGRDYPVWISGHRITVNRWPFGLSDDIQGTQCMTMDGGHNFEWNAYPCDRLSHFVCEETYLYNPFG